MDNYNGTYSDECRISETWKALDLYGIAVSDKGRIRVNGVILDPNPPYKQYKRWHFIFTNPKTGEVIKRDAAIMVWRAFKGKVGKDIRIIFKDGDISNLCLDNLNWEYIIPKPKAQYSEHSELTFEQMKARVPLVLDKMAAIWGKKD